MRKFFLLFMACLALSCNSVNSERERTGVRHAEFFDILDDGSLITISPYTHEADTVVIDREMDTFVCMSTTHVAFLEYLGCDSTIKAVSGLSYVSSEALRSRNDVYDVGYEQELDYERILSLHPDAVFAYAVSAVEPPYVAKLKSLGVNVIMVNEHLEGTALARAEYIRMFGALTGTMDRADSLFAQVERRYEALKCNPDSMDRVKVLMNIPYEDQWFIPGGDNYMSHLVRDAGGEILGAKDGSRESSTVSVERAYLMAKEAQVWLNTGWCNTKAQLMSTNPVFSSFGIDRIYNNTLRTNPEGGNDFWESAVVRPDMVLEDLRRIFRGEEGSFNYYLEVN